MSPLKSVDEIREELSDLIREAVPEANEGRRMVLLTLADHWSDIMRRRTAGGGSLGIL